VRVQKTGTINPKKRGKLSLLTKSFEESFKQRYTMSAGIQSVMLKLSRTILEDNSKISLPWTIY
jgi:hypothetical protein